MALKTSGMRESVVCKRETKQERGTEAEPSFLSPPGLVLVKVPPCDYAVTSLEALETVRGLFSEASWSGGYTVTREELMNVTTPRDPP